jgi:hypothetical protein
MPSIINSWVEKVKPKKKVETAPAYEKSVYRNDFATQTRKPEKRSTPCLKITMNRSCSNTFRK